MRCVPGLALTGSAARRARKVSGVSERALVLGIQGVGLWRIRTTTLLLRSVVPICYVSPLTKGWRKVALGVGLAGAHMHAAYPRQTSVADGPQWRSHKLFCSERVPHDSFRSRPGGPCLFTSAPRKEA